MDASCYVLPVRFICVFSLRTDKHAKAQDGRRCAQEVHSEGEEGACEHLGSAAWLVRLAPTKLSLLVSLSQDNELFRSFMHQDAHEFLNFLLNTCSETLESEVRVPRGAVAGRGVYPRRRPSSVPPSPGTVAPILPPLPPCSFLSGDRETKRSGLIPAGARFLAPELRLHC